MTTVEGKGRWEGWTLRMDDDGRFLGADLTEAARERNDAYLVERGIQRWDGSEVPHGSRKVWVPRW